MGLKYNCTWVSISLIGGVLISLVYLRQTELKALIAYFSVAHMVIVLEGLMTLSCWGLSGSYTLMTGQGLCSSALFCLANMTKESLGSRSLLINNSLLNFMPSMTLWGFLLSVCNMAFFIKFISGNYFIFISGMINNNFFIISFFFSADFTLYLYAYSQLGKVFSMAYSFSGGNTREYFLLFLHWSRLNLLILKSEICLFLL